MVNLRNLLGLEPEPNWERMDWLPSTPENEEDEEAMREWRCRTKISIFLYNLELRERQEYFKKHGALLEEQINGVCIRKGKRLIRKKRCVFPKAFLVVSNKRKRCDCEGMVCGKEDEKTKIKIKNNMISAIPVLPYPPVPVLPIGLKNHIQDMGGSEDVILVIQKPLFKTDVSRNNNRFSIPLSQVKNKFLTEEEMEHLDTRYDGNVSEIEVILIEPCLVYGSINLRKWDMATTKTFVLVTTWYSVVSRNQLREGTVVQLWSFRVGPQLGFALVNI